MIDPVPPVVPEPTSPPVPVGPALLLRSPSFARIASALSKAQAAFTPIEKNCTARISSRRTGQTFTYDYADLAAIREATAPALAANGLALIHAVATENIPGEEPEQGSRFALIKVQTELIHESGEWFRTPLLETVVDLTDVKEIGIATTYFRRYQVQTLLAITPEEDKDADGAGERKENFRAAPPPQGGNGVNPGRFTCRHGHKHSTAEGAKNCQDEGGGEATAPAAERTLEPGEDPPAMKTANGDVATKVRAAIAAADWRTVVTALGQIPESAQKRELQEAYNTARYGAKEQRA